MKDPVFGEMEYDFQWQKDETIELWGKSYSVQIVAQSEDDDDTEISQVQRDAYVFFKSNFASLAESGMESILNYCVEDLGLSNCTRADFLANSKPTTVFFALSGAWGILFDTTYSQEDGIALMYSDGQWVVDTQDILI